MIGDCFGQTAIASKSSTPVTVFFTVGDEGRVGIKSVQNRLKDSVSELINAIGRHGFALVVISITNFFAQLFNTRHILMSQQHVRFCIRQGRNVQVGEHQPFNSTGILLQVHARGLNRVDGQTDRVRDYVNDLFVDGFDLIFASYTGFDQLTGKGGNGINLLPGFNFFLVTIGVGI